MRGDKVAREVGGVSRRSEGAERQVRDVIEAPGRGGWHWVESWTLERTWRVARTT